jgi:two-component system LytT family response regulator
LKLWNPGTLDLGTRNLETWNLELKKMLNFKLKIGPTMLRTLIIDDESHIRVTLARFLARYCPQAQLVGEAGSVEEGLVAIHLYHPDLVLLDIKMDDGTGFDLLRQLDHVGFKVIFVTAFEKYAVQAFKYSAVDFLLKPVNPQELAGAVQKAMEMTQGDYLTRLKALEDNFKSNEAHKRKIILKTLENIYLIDVQDIIYCESDGSYTTIHTVKNNPIITSRLLREYDEMLEDAGFFRIHKSYLINLRHLRRFERPEGGFIVLTNDHKLPVASRKKDELLEMLESLVK